MTTPKWIKLKFKNNLSVEIELLQNEFVDSWYRAFINNQHIARWTRDQAILLHNDAHTPNYTEHAKILVDNINAAIRTIEKISGKKWIGYAYIGMSWETTNYLHRGFTTSMITKYKTPYLSKKLQKDILDMKKNGATHYQISDFIINHPTLEDFYQLSDDNNDEFFNALEKINSYIHFYESSYLRSSRANELDRNNGCLVFDIDGKTVDGGCHENFYEEMVQPDFSQFSFQGSEYNVYALKKILGKDYLTAYFQFDDPTAWDISNMMIIDGTFEIDYNDNYNYLYNSTGFNHWIEHFELQNRNIFSNYQIGKVINQEFLTTIKSIQPVNIVNNNIETVTRISETHSLGVNWDIISIESEDGVIL